MISLSGLSATYPGYAAQEDQTAKTQVNQTKARDAAIKLLGANVAGAALAGGQQGPQAPPPGQPSVPAPRPMPPPAGPTSVGGAPLQPPGPPAAIPPQGAPPVPQGGPSVPAPTPQPAAPVAPAPVAAGAPAGKMGLQQAVQSILRATPGVANHPEVLLSALTHFNDIGVLDPEAGAKVEEANKLHTTARIGAAKGHLKAVQDAAGTPAPEDATPAGPAPAAGPTATDPKTGAKVQWDGKVWQPMPS